MVEIKNYSSKKEFYYAVQSLLEKDEVANNLPLGILLSSLESEVTPSMIHLGALVANKVELMFFQDGPHIIVVGDQTYVPDLVAYLIENHRPISSFIGEVALVDACGEAVAQQMGCSVVTKFNQRIYKLTQVAQMLNPPEGHFRFAEYEDADQLCQWTQAFMEEIDEKYDEQEIEDAVTLMIMLNQIVVWENQTIVTMARAVRPTNQGIVVSGVYTPPKYRGKGYATACVRNLSEHLLTEYAYCALYTDLANNISNAIYMKIGYQPVCDSKLIIIK